MIINNSWLTRPSPVARVPWGFGGISVKAGQNEPGEARCRTQVSDRRLPTGRFPPRTKEGPPSECPPLHRRNVRTRRRERDDRATQTRIHETTFVWESSVDCRSKEYSSGLERRTGISSWRKRDRERIKKKYKNKKTGFRTKKTTAARRIDRIETESRGWGGARRSKSRWGRCYFRVISRRFSGALGYCQPVIILFFFVVVVRRLRFDRVEKPRL